MFYTQNHGNAGYVHSSYWHGGESHRAVSHGGEVIGEYATATAAKRALTIAHNQWLKQWKRGTA